MIQPTRTRLYSNETINEGRIPGREEVSSSIGGKNLVLLLDSSKPREHLKAIGHVPATDALFDKAGVATEADDGTVSLADPGGIRAFVAAAKKHRIWDREPGLRAAGAPKKEKARKRA